MNAINDRVLHNHQATLSTALKAYNMYYCCRVSWQCVCSSRDNWLAEMAMIVEDNDFSHGDAEASITHPVKCSTLRKGGHIVISRFPCRIVELSTAQPGKHGHSKVHIIGVDIFTGKKHEDICPSKENVEVCMKPEHNQ